MSTILEDIPTFSEMIVDGFKEDKLILDYTLTSFKRIDHFFDKHSKNGKTVAGGLLSKNLGQILFALGAYVGQTIIAIVPGTTWQVDESDPYGEVTAELKLPNESSAWPMQRVIKRFRNGSEDGIYGYGYFIVKNYVDIKDLLNFEEEQSIKKPWWKIW